MPKIDQEWVKTISEQLAVIYIFTNHHWRKVGEKDCHVPNATEISKTLTRLLDESLPPTKGFKISQGGITVWMDDAGPVVKYELSIMFHFNNGDSYIS